MQCTWLYWWHGMKPILKKISCIKGSLILIRAITLAMYGCGAGAGVPEPTHFAVSQSRWDIPLGAVSPPLSQNRSRPTLSRFHIPIILQQ